MDTRKQSFNDNNRKINKGAQYIIKAIRGK